MVVSISFGTTWYGISIFFWGPNFQYHHAMDLVISKIEPWPPTFNLLCNKFFKGTSFKTTQLQEGNFSHAKIYMWDPDAQYILLKWRQCHLLEESKSGPFSFPLGKVLVDRINRLNTILRTQHYNSTLASWSLNTRPMHRRESHAMIYQTA